MRPFNIVTNIEEYDTFAEFAEANKIGSSDLILTNEYIYKPAISSLELGCQTLFQEKYGISPEECIAFGDEYNDIEMLKRVGCGIAMGNGTDDAKGVADYVTDTLHDDGIYNACKHFGLI